MDRIAAQFESYQNEVVSREASENQVLETRRAFYAGAAAMFTIFQVIGTDRVSEAESEQILMDADHELRAFSESVVKGVN